MTQRIGISFCLAGLIWLITAFPAVAQDRRAACASLIQSALDRVESADPKSEQSISLLKSSNCPAPADQICARIDLR